MTRQSGGGRNVQFVFADHTLDIERRELRRGSESIAVEPQVLDLLMDLSSHYYGAPSTPLALANLARTE